MFVMTRYPKAGPKALRVKGDTVFDVVDTVRFVSQTRLVLLRIVNDVYYVKDSHGRVLTIHRDPRDAMRPDDV